MKKSRILLVDDDPGLLRLLSIRLDAAGYEVESVENAESALTLLPRVRPHVVITDLRMDGMDGMALFGAIHSINPSLPVIILTAHGTIPEAVSATRNGVFSFLTKPFEGKALLEEINKALKISGVIDKQFQDNEWCRDIITHSPIMEDLLIQTHLLAQGDVSVFICGQSGTGKELIANAIHKANHRRDHPFIAINCSAIPESLLESELFGHCKGSFTGATKDYVGLFRAAHGGTLFLDEIGDMPLLVQAKLLRALQDHSFRPVGSTKDINVDVRVISATHKDIDKAMSEGTFREDLYYRLNVASIEVPPLSDRREDISLLVQHFLGKTNQKNQKKVVISSEAMQLLVAAPWPGNVRQLSNAVEQMAALATGTIITPAMVRKALRVHDTAILTFAEARMRFELEYLSRLLRITGGKVSLAARLAKRNRTDFYKLMQRHKLEAAGYKNSRQENTDN